MSFMDVFLCRLKDLIVGASFYRGERIGGAVYIYLNSAEVSTHKIDEFNEFFVINLVLQCGVFCILCLNRASPAQRNRTC